RELQQRAEWPSRQYTQRLGHTRAAATTVTVTATGHTSVKTPRTTQRPQAPTHAKAPTSTPTDRSPARTAPARATAAGESPCTHKDRAATSTSVPSIARTVPDTAISTARPPTSSGSDNTAPGEERGTSVPCGV